MPTSGALKTTGTPDLLAFCFSTGLCILVAAALFYHVEQPGRRWVMSLYRTHLAPLLTRQPAPSV